MLCNICRNPTFVSKFKSPNDCMSSSVCSCLICYGSITYVSNIHELDILATFFCTRYLHVGLHNNTKLRKRLNLIMKKTNTFYIFLCGFSCSMSDKDIYLIRQICIIIRRLFHQLMMKGGVQSNNAIYLYTDFFLLLIYSEFMCCIVNHKINILA